MRTEVTPLTVHKLMPASGARDENGRAITLGLPDAIDFAEVVDGVGAVTGRLELVEHRYELVHLEVRASSIGPDELRRIPVRALMVAAARRHAQVATVSERGMSTKDLSDELTDDEVVVALWHLARACRTNPNPLIRQQLRLSSDQAAARRVAALRVKNVLPPAEKKGQRY